MIARVVARTELQPPQVVRDCLTGKRRDPLQTRLFRHRRLRKELNITLGDVGVVGPFGGPNLSPTIECRKCRLR